MYTFVTNLSFFQFIVCKNNPISSCELLDILQTSKFLCDKFSILFLILISCYQCKGHPTGFLLSLPIQCVLKIVEEIFGSVFLQWPGHLWKILYSPGWQLWHLQQDNYAPAIFPSHKLRMFPFQN